jgi:hypothetical protein
MEESIKLPMDEILERDIILSIIDHFADGVYDENYTFCWEVERHINGTLKLNIDYRKVHKMVSEFLSGDL